MSVSKHIPHGIKDLMVYFLRDFFRLFNINAQVFVDTVYKLRRMRKTEYDVARFFREKSDLFHREAEFLAHLENTLGIFRADHLIFKRLGEALKVGFNFLRVVWCHENV